MRQGNKEANPKRYEEIGKLTLKLKLTKL